MIPLGALAGLDGVVPLLRSEPALVVLVGVLTRLGLAYQRGLSWYEYRTVHGLKRLLFPWLERLTPVALLVTQKGGRDDAEFLAHRPATVRATARHLQEAGGRLHLINALKRRPATHGDPLTAAHLVWTHADGTQTEAYLFRNDDGSVDVYAHRETSVTDPVGHLTDTQTNGDPRGVVKRALGDVS